MSDTSVAGRASADLLTERAPSDGATRTTRDRLPIRSKTAISVVIATRGRPTELKRCLRSLLAQRKPAKRIVVVDDAPGGEATPRAVVECLDAASPIVYVEGGSRGLAAAHNRGLLEVDTPLVAFTDDDVITDEDWLARIADAFRAAPDVGCVTGKIVPLELRTPGQMWLDGYAGFDKGDERRLFDLGENRPADPLFPFTAGALGSGANMAFSKEALLEMGGFDAALGAGTRARGGDDLAAFLEVILRGYRLVYEPAAIVRHRHPRDHLALKRQVFGYGVGLTAYLTRSFVDHPKLLGPAALRLPRALVYGLSSRSPRNARQPDDYPPRLNRVERFGMLAGPIAYIRSRRRARARR